ncbi:MAG: sulfatase-like hydrolase/transferase [Desulfurellaceae bacterium]|nr:sulfatase-like hydrolase/transferase [Desulfurellaceae bacterium]
MGLAPPSLRSHNTQADFLFPGLHLLVLWNFAVAQPLFDLFSRTAEFFVLRQSPALDIALFAILLSIVVPALGVLVTWGIRAVHTGSGVGLHLFLVGGLSAMLALQALQMLQTLPHISGLVLMLGAGGIGLLASVSYHILPLVRTFCTLLSPGIVLFPVLFLFFSPVSTLLFSSPVDIAQVKVNDPPPIVLVIFDEFSSISLMDKNRQIDAGRYPNFAAFAEDATWFRNASTMSSWTPRAVPAILTGSYPVPNRLPTVSGYPRNIFTLLGGTYAVRAHGTITELCPHELCNQLREPWSVRMRTLLSDISIVYLHILLPEDQKAGLPSLQARWKDFAGGPALLSQAEERQIPAHAWKSLQDSILAQLDLRLDRPRIFHSFLHAIRPTHQPTLHYLHILLPHVPYEYLRSGQTYSADGGHPGIAEEMWSGDTWAATQSYQRYLLQVEFVDTLLGQLIAHLKSARLYEKSLIVITADHGASFRPHDNRRAVTKTNFADIMAIPLFVKAPFQQQGEILDRNMETIDILPTIADILGIKLPWPVDGGSAFSPEPRAGTEKSSSLSTQIALDRFNTAVREAVGKQADRFPPDDPVVPHASLSALVGQRIQDMPMSEDTQFAITIDQLKHFAQVDPKAQFLPAHITGTLHSEEFRFIALALNETVRAVTQPWSFAVKGRDGRWSALLDPQFFRSGKNTLEAFGVRTRNDRATLVRAAGSPQHLPVFRPRAEEQKDLQKEE